MVIPTMSRRPVLRFSPVPSKRRLPQNSFLFFSTMAQIPTPRAERARLLSSRQFKSGEQTYSRACLNMALIRTFLDQNVSAFGMNTFLFWGTHDMLWPSTYQPQCLQILLSHGAEHKKCPGIMELAVSINNIESVRILLKAGVSPDIKKDGTYTPLCTAIRDDRPDLVKLLLSNGAGPNTMASEYPAFKCVTHNRVHFLPLLVSAGANLHNPKGILETAVSSNNIEALNWLLDQGVNPNDKSPKDPHLRGQDWPICMAVRNPAILKRILAVVSEPQAFKGIIEMAVSANQLESVKLLIAAGVSVEDKNGGVFSPLTTSIREDRREIVAYLLNDGGADVNAPGEHLPIVKALRRYHGEGDTEIMEMLLEHGADPNKIYRGWNAIMQAIENGDAEILRLLSRKAGVDLEAKDEMGRTVVEMAASRGWDEAVQILMEGDVGLRLRK
ncbi:ankyrin [Acephala macrosclerotiorum]|nr:ankyrin [Acephala macrosclerotiorum]